MLVYSKSQVGEGYIFFSFLSWSAVPSDRKKEVLMPKIKTHKGAAKRFKFTAKGKIRRKRAYAGHLFISKSSKQKRRLRQATLVDPSNEKRLKRLIHQ